MKKSPNTSTIPLSRNRTPGRVTSTAMAARLANVIRAGRKSGACAERSSDTSRGTRRGTIRIGTCRRFRGPILRTAAWGRATIDLVAPPRPAVAAADRQIAEHVGVASNTVLKYRQELATTGQIDQSASKRTGKDGIERSLPIAKKPKVPKQISVPTPAAGGAPQRAGLQPAAAAGPSDWGGPRVSHPPRRIFFVHDQETHATTPERDNIS